MSFDLLWAAVAPEDNQLGDCRPARPKLHIELINIGAGFGWLQHDLATLEAFEPQPG